MLLTQFATMTEMWMNEAEDLDSLEWNREYCESYFFAHKNLWDRPIDELEKKLGHLSNIYHRRKIELTAKAKTQSLVARLV